MSGFCFMDYASEGALMMGVDLKWRKCSIRIYFRRYMLNAEGRAGKKK